MPSDLRVAFDTNTLVSAFLLPDSTPRQALNAATAAGRLLLSAPTAAELTEVLLHPGNRDVANFVNLRMEVGAKLSQKFAAVPSPVPRSFAHYRITSSQSYS